MDLDPGLSDDVEIDFKARHNNGYLRSYSVIATSNAGDHVVFASDHYGNYVASGPGW